MPRLKNKNIIDKKKRKRKKEDNAKRVIESSE